MLRKTRGTRGWGRALLAAVAGAVTGAAAHAGCPADFDASGDVGFDDLVSLLAAWGPCTGCLEDLDGSGDVDFDDLVTLLAAWGPCAGPSDEPIATQLAGLVLDRPPNFDYVRAVSEGSSFSVAIDPRYLNGLTPTCDVYITAARTSSQWELDPTLVDVRGVPQEVTFDGATIQANAFDVTEAAGLSGAGGLEFGVGYDVVCDCNQNGVFDDGDIIDGFGDVAGIYVVDDPTALGPLAISVINNNATAGSVTTGFESRRIFYPTDIASLGALPLVVISHGNGHNYTWYDYLGNHFASHGYIVLTHENNTVPGIETASSTTWQHTEAFLSQLPSIGGGVLVGRVDSSRIVWIGHSRGGEGVVRAYTRVNTGAVTPTTYSADDIVLLSSIAPNNSLGPTASRPADSNYHLIWGSADGDISGAPNSVGTWSFAIYERATGYRQSTYVHGADHNDFNCCGFDDFNGPGGTAIGRTEAQQVAKATYLTLIERYVQGSPAALDYLWRPRESIRELGINPATVIVRDYHEADEVVPFVIDDFQTNTASSTSSSGGGVAFDVDNYLESLLDENDGTYNWSAGDPMNGMSRVSGGDDERGAVFDWPLTGTRLMEFAVVAGQRDWTSYEYLSFRACQQSHHPATVALIEDLTFSVRLRDGSGNASVINFGDYGGGIQEPYQRAGGWQNEFEVVRIRLTDFCNNGNADLDLSDIAAVRFEFGGAFGSSIGRIGFDDLHLSADVDPPLAGALALSVPDGTPSLVPPNSPTAIPVLITAAAETIVPGTPAIHYRFDGGVFISEPLTPIGGGQYEATLPAATCGETPQFFFSAQGSVSGKVFLPFDAPASFFEAGVGIVNEIVTDDFETDTGWTVTNVSLTDGGWDRGDPVGGGDRGDPPDDFDGSGQCWLTDNVDDNSDVDGGPTILTSPTYALAAHPEAIISYARWFTNDDGDIDRLDVEVSNNNGGSWTLVESVPGGAAWVETSFRLADFLTPTDQVRIRFSATDNPNDSVTEAGLDALRIFTVTCD